MRRTTKASILISICAALVFSPGCTNYGANRTKLDNQTIALAQNNNAAVGIALEEVSDKIKETSQKVDTALLLSTNKILIEPIKLSLNDTWKPFYLAEDWIVRNQSLLGSPTESQSQRVKDLLSTNLVLQVKSKDLENKLIDKESKSIAELREKNEILKNLGLELERQRNESIKKKWKWGLILSGVLAALGTALYFAGPLIGFFPVLSKILGVVPTTFLTNKIKSIGELRYKLKGDIEHNKTSNLQKTVILEDILEFFDGQLREDENDADNQIVSEIREKINL